MLGSRLHHGHNALPRQPLLHGLTQTVGTLLSLVTLFMEPLRHLPVGLRLQKPERQVFQLPLDLPDAQPVGQRREHMQRFLRQFRRNI